MIGMFSQPGNSSAGKRVEKLWPYLQFAFH
jgi:hypothetical protein